MLLIAILVLIMNIIGYTNFTITTLLFIELTLFLLSVIELKIIYKLIFKKK